MSNVRFIADLHLGHKWMAKHRGFKDTVEHDEHIIKQWNKISHKKDLTYILGDITMEDNFPYYQLDRLKGRKIVIGGNHDLKKHSAELLKYVESIIGVLDYKGYCFSHIPIHQRELWDNNYKNRYRGNVHGHVHDNSIDDPHYYNVSAEMVDYTPRKIEELVERNCHIFNFDGRLFKDYKEINW